MRTQHRRPATLEEALLSLSAQSCDDFELLLLPHDVSEGGIVEVQALVDAYPPSFVAVSSLSKVVGALAR